MVRTGALNLRMLIINTHGLYRLIKINYQFVDISCLINLIGGFLIKIFTKVKSCFFNITIEK